MKKLLAGLMFLCLVAPAVSQTTCWTETFDSYPTGWVLEEPNWTHAGSFPGTVWLNWSPSTTNYDMSAYSDWLPIPSTVNDLIVTQYIQDYSAVNEIFEISVITNDGEEVIWTHNLTDGDWGYSGGEELVVPLTDYAGEDVKFRFRSYGSSTYNIDYWIIYELSMTATFDYDMAALEVYGPPNAENHEEEAYRVKVKNTGANSVDEYTVKLFKDGFEYGSIDVTTPLESGQEVYHDFTWMPNDETSTTFYGKVIYDADAIEINNQTATLDVYVFPQGALQILVWDNDNDSYVTIDLVTYGTQIGIGNALTSNNTEYLLVTELPKVLYNYDAVFALLGIYCVG